MYNVPHPLPLTFKQRRCLEIGAGAPPDSVSTLVFVILSPVNMENIFPLSSVDLFSVECVPFCFCCPFYFACCFLFAADNVLKNTTGFTFDTKRKPNPCTCCIVCSD
eukprot:RCo036536